MMCRSSDGCGPRCTMPPTFDYFSCTGGLFHTVAMMSEAMKRTIKHGDRYGQSGLDLRSCRRRVPHADDGRARNDGDFDSNESLGFINLTNWMWRKASARTYLSAM